MKLIDISAVASEEGIVEEEPTTTPLRILVVDDSMATRKVLTDASIQSAQTMYRLPIFASTALR